MQKERPNARRAGENSYISHSKAREAQRKSGESLIVHLFLCIVLPPVGLLLAWHSRHLNTLSRAAASLCALAVLTGAFVLLGGSESSAAILPAPQTPELPGYGNAAQTAEPDIYVDGQDSVGGYQITYGDGTTEETLTQDGELPVDPLSQVTIVYAVTNNAQYYHSQEICDMQTNSRRLILEDAISEGLKPCEKCYPDGAPTSASQAETPVPEETPVPSEEGVEGAVG